MKPRFYLDEDSMRLALVQALRARGADILVASAAGMLNRPDEEHLEYATAQGRVLYSFNVADYQRLHTTWLAESRSHAGIVLARQQQYSVGEQMRRLLKLMAVLSADEMQNRVEFLSAWN